MSSKRKISIAGFSIVEALVAMGIMGAGALVMMKMNQNQVASQKTAETSFEMQAVISAATSALLDKNICTETFKGLNITNGMTINQISRPNPAAPATPIVLVRVGDVYGNGMVKVNSMTVALDGPLMDVGTEKFGTGSLTLEMQKLSKVAQNKYDMRKKLGVIIRFKTTSAGAFLSCYSDADSNSENLKIAICESLGGVWDSTAAGKCNLQEHPSAPVNQSTAASTKYVNDYGATKVNKAGDTMTGDLTLPNLNTTGAISAAGNIASATALCVGPNCRNFAAQACAINEYAHAIEANGSVTCKPLPKCPSNQYLAGVESTGAMICRNLPGNQCGANQYITQVNADGSVQCATIPASAGVPQVDFSFFDGYNNTTNTWSRKSIDQVAQQICARFNGYTWDGSKCNGSAGAAADSVWTKYNDRIEFAPTGSDFKLIIYNYGYTSWQYKGVSSAAITVNGTSLGAHGPGGILFLNASADNATSPSRSTTFSHGRLYMNNGDISISGGSGTGEIDFGFSHQIHGLNGLKFDGNIGHSLSKNASCSSTSDQNKIRVARFNNDTNNTRLMVCLKVNGTWQWKEMRWFD